MGAAMSNHLSKKREQKEHEEFIAQEIHDGACQYAIAAKMAFEKYRREKTESGSENWDGFDAGLAFLDHTIEELRQLVRGLQPIRFSADGFPAAIEDLIKKVRAAGGPETLFSHGDIDARRIPAKLKWATFRILQESLANACRHSKSKRLFVQLSLDGNVLRIHVRDWGVGFDPGGVPPGHFGLEGIRRRVRLLRGYATIRSRLGKGTCVTVKLPLAHAAR
jgi:two-component system sensor histidine kinase DegS